MMPQDAYLVALEELVKHIHRERSKFDVAFLEESLEEQSCRGYRRQQGISTVDEDVEDNAPVPSDPLAP